MNKAERESKRRQAILKKSRDRIPPDTSYINSSVAIADKVLFSFANLDLNRGIFKCSAGKGQELLNILDDFKKHSGYNRIEMGQRKNFHPLSPENIKDHNLQDLVRLAGGTKLFQMGSQAHPERIVGFFESMRSYVFKVCLLDVDHKLNPE